MNRSSHNYTDKGPTSSFNGNVVVWTFPCRRFLDERNNDYPNACIFPFIVADVAHDEQIYDL